MSDFDRDVTDLKEQIEKFEQLPITPQQQDDLVAMRQTLEKLERTLAATQERLVDSDAWERTLLARHEQRPYTLDMVALAFTAFSEIHGDRRFRDDPAMVCGFALFDGRPVMIVGHQKGRNMKDRLFRNYGMPKPEGYRKALRAMKLAEKFRVPILIFIDTPGAYPGIGAEERGQAEAIAYNLREMAKLRVPVIVTVLGEGGSGGALAVGVGDRVLMLENAIYSVISPESCSAILWKDQDHVREAATSLRLSAPDLLHLGLIDEIVPEPPDGAHIDFAGTAARLSARLRFHLDTLEKLTESERTQQRYEKYRRMGV